ncbi:hypothetical protein ILUMI_26904, partial [Ignelater luminosus]
YTVDSANRREIYSLTKLLLFYSVQRDKDGKTPLILAAENEQIDLVKSLVDVGGNIEETDNLGNTALIWATWNNHPAIKKGVHGGNALIWAAREGTADAVKTLLSRGSKPDVRSNDQKTPLIQAAETGQLDTVKYLVNRDVDIEAEDNAGNTALIWATWNDHPAIVEFLLSRGANIEHAQKEGQNTNNFCCSATPLYNTWNNYADVVEFLLSKGANIEAAQEEKQTLLPVIDLRSNE